MNLYLASIGSRKFLTDCLKNTNIMFSYFSIRKKSGGIEDWVGEVLKSDEINEVMIDSGAFSFMNSQDSEDFDDYLKEYIKFINEYDIDLFMELDIERIKDMETVEKYRKIIIEETGKKPIPVWHPERGIDYFRYMAKNFDYIAIGGMAQQSKMKYRSRIEKFFPWFIKIAHKHNAKIHGLGYTSLRGIKKYNFDSVDSSSWIGSRFGKFWLFNGFDMESVSRPERLLDYKQADRLSFNEWKKFQKFVKVRY